MIVSPVDRMPLTLHPNVTQRSTMNVLHGIALGAITALSLAMSTAPVAAQTTGPTTPVPLFSAAPPAPVEAEETLPPAGGGIQVQALDKVGASAIGLIDAQSGGLPVDIWQRSHPDMPALLISKLPEGIASPALRALTIRMLATAAPLPRGPGNTNPGAEATNRFLTARINTLVRLGAAGEALALADSLGSAARDVAIARATAEAALSAGQEDRACALAPTIPPEADSDGFWQRVQVFCQIRTGDSSGAELSTQLLRDLGQASPLFLALADALGAGVAANLSNIAEADPLERAMLRQLGETAPQMPRPSLAELEQQVVRGLTPAATLAEAYAGAEVTAASLSDPVKAAFELDGTEARALLYQAATIQSVPAAKGELIRAALESAAQDGLMIALAPAFAEPIDNMQPDNSLWRFAGTAARFLYATGRADKARVWHGILGTRTLGDPTAAAENALLWPYATITGKQDIDTLSRGLSAAGQTWRSTAVAEQQDGGPGAERALFLMSALGLPVDGLSILHAFSSDRGEAPTRGAVLDALLLRGMRQAAQDSRAGDAIALAAIALGPHAPAVVDGASLAEIVSVLQDMGLSSDAEALALEALP